MESEEKWGEPSDAELETLIEDRLAEGPLDSEPMTMRPPLLPIVLVLFGFAFLFWAFWFG
jgi:hypothetical protein